MERQNSAQHLTPRPRREGVAAGKRCRLNPAGARLIGYEPDELLGRNMHDLTHHAWPDGTPCPEDQCPIFNAFRQGLPCRIDTEVFWRRDGSAFAVEWSQHAKNLATAS